MTIDCHTPTLSTVEYTVPSMNVLATNGSPISQVYSVFALLEVYVAATCLTFDTSAKLTGVAATSISEVTLGAHHDRDIGWPSTRNRGIDR